MSSFSTTQLPSLAARVGILLLLSWLVVAMRPGAVSSRFALPSPWADATVLTFAANTALAAASSAGPSTEQSLGTAKRLAGEALDASPLASDAVRILGLVAEREGGEPIAHRLVEIAAARSARDLQARAWLMIERLRVEDYGGALAHLSALARVSGAVSGYLYPVLRAVATQPKGREALAELLATSPPWRTPFLKQLALGDQPAETLMQLLSLLAKRGARPPLEEYAPLTQRLVGDGQFELAYVVWLEAQTPDHLNQVKNVNNGGFEHSPNGSPFDWAFIPAEGVWVGITSGADGGKQLRVVFDASEGQFQNVSQTLMLAPGSYELSAVAQTENLDTRRGLWWRVLCVGGQVIGTTDPIQGNTPRTLLRARVTVPKAACPAQILRLELAARGTFEARVSGEALFDDVEIKRISAPAQ